VADIIEKQRALAEACAASIIIGLTAVEAPIAPSEADVRDQVVRLRDGTLRHLSPKLFALFVVLSDGERHDPSELYAALQLRHPTPGSLREHISRLRRLLRGSDYVIENRRGLGYRLTLERRKAVHER
jgi:DNA-binding response OmpR family regulator